MIQTMKTQLAGLETMIAAIANFKKDDVKSVPRKNPDYSTDQSLSEEEDLTIDKMIEMAREQELQRMALEAEKYGQTLMQESIDASK
jgi:hypothetical protein